MPFAGYEDFDACVLANKDKDSPEAYCADIYKKTTGKWPSEKEMVNANIKIVEEKMKEEIKKDKNPIQKNPVSANDPEYMTEEPNVPEDKKEPGEYAKDVKAMEEQIEGLDADIKQMNKDFRKKADEPGKEEMEVDVEGNTEEKCPKRENLQKDSINEYLSKKKEFQHQVK